MKFRGIPKVYKYGFAIWAKEWNDMPIKKQDKYEPKLEEKADSFYKSMKKNNIRIPLKSKLLLIIFKRLMKSYPDGNSDKEYWRGKGWLEDKKPWEN